MDGNRIEFLKKVNLFENITEEELAVMSEICKEQPMKAGDTIIREGEEGGCVFIIEEGHIEISMSIMLSLFEENAPARDKVLVRLGPGALFGEMAFIFSNDVRSATIVALTDGKLLRIDSSDFRKFAEENYKPAYHILRNIAKTIAKRLRKTNQDVSKLTTVLSIAMSKTQRRSG